MDKVSLNGVEIFPFDSEQQLLHYVLKRYCMPRNKHVSSSIEILGIVMEPVRKWL